MEEIYDDEQTAFEESLWLLINDGEREFLTRDEIAGMLRDVASEYDGRDVILSYDESFGGF